MSLWGGIVGLRDQAGPERSHGGAVDSARIVRQCRLESEIASADERGLERANGRTHGSSGISGDRGVVDNLAQRQTANGAGEDARGAVVVESADKDEVAAVQRDRAETGKGARGPRRRGRGVSDLGIGNGLRSRQGGTRQQGDSQSEGAGTRVRRFSEKGERVRWIAEFHFPRG